MFHLATRLRKLRKVVNMNGARGRILLAARYIYAVVVRIEEEEKKNTAKAKTFAVVRYFVY